MTLEIIGDSVFSQSQAKLLSNIACPHSELRVRTNFKSLKSFFLSKYKNVEKMVLSRQLILIGLLAESMGMFVSKKI